MAANRRRTKRCTRAAGACFSRCFISSSLPQSRGRVNSAVRRLFGHSGGSQMKVVAVLLLLCVSVLAQSREDLTKKYGAPRSETFLLRSNIAATVSYGSNGQIKELIIAPFTNALIKS